MRFNKGLWRLPRDPFLDSLLFPRLYLLIMHMPRCVSAIHILNAAVSPSFYTLVRCADLLCGIKHIYGAKLVQVFMETRVYTRLGVFLSIHETPPPPLT